MGPPRFENGCLNLGGPIGIDDGDPTDCGLLSLAGDAVKHSSGDIRDAGGNDAALLANLNGTQSTLADFSESDVVEEPFVRDKVGRRKLGLRRLGLY